MNYGQHLKKQKQVHKLEVDMAQNYARKDELEIRLDKLRRNAKPYIRQVEKKADKE